jgi:membrane-associated phospholipid phosphatase
MSEAFEGVSFNQNEIDQKTGRPCASLSFRSHPDKGLPDKGLIVRIMKPEWSDEKWADQLSGVLKRAESRRDRIPEILTQVAVPLAFYGMVLNLHPEQHHRVFELMGILFQIGKQTVMRFKHHFNHPRPAELWPFVQPLILTPGHASYPAGHATETHLVSTVFAALLRSILPGDQPKDENDKPHDDNSPECNYVNRKENVLFKLAARISENRIYAGLHYPEDNAVGKQLGISLAEHLLKRVGILGLDGNIELPNNTNLGLNQQDNPLKGTAPNLAWLFHEARKELAGR